MICVIHNEDSGFSNDLEQIKSGFARHGLKARYVPISDVNKPLVSGQLKKYHTLVAAGGDGTVNAVAALAISNDTKLGVVPAGTFNHFAKDAGLPLDTNEAIDAIAAGRTTQIDIAEVNEKIFLNNSGIGLYPRIVRKRDKYSPYLSKPVAHILSSLMVLTRRRGHRLLVSIDGHKIDHTTPFVFIGNNSYHLSKFGFTNREGLDKGELCLYMLKTNAIIKIIWSFLCSLLGRVNSKDFEEHLGQSVIIGSNKSHLDVTLDGEICRLPTPLRYAIKPKLLQLIIPT